MVRVGRTRPPFPLNNLDMVLVLRENILDARNPRANKHDQKVLEDPLEKPVRLGGSRDVKRHHDDILEYVPTRAQNKHHVRDGAPPANVKHKRLFYGRSDLVYRIGRLPPCRVPIRVIHLVKERTAQIQSKIINELVQLCAHSDVTGLAWCVHCCCVVSLPRGSSWGRGDPNFWARTFFGPGLESGSAHCLSSDPPFSGLPRSVGASCSMGLRDKSYTCPEPRGSAGWRELGGPEFQTYILVWNSSKHS